MFGGSAHFFTKQCDCGLVFGVVRFTQFGSVWFDFIVSKTEPIENKMNSFGLSMDPNLIVVWFGSTSKLLAPQSPHIQYIILTRESLVSTLFPHTQEKERQRDPLHFRRQILQP